MPVGRAYLDHNATSPLRPEARAAMAAALDIVGNPSSVHAEGRAARAAIERARQQVAALVGAQPREVIFTSGGTEANNAVLTAGWDVIVLAGTEHDSVLVPAERSGARAIVLPNDTNGVAATAALGGALAGLGASAGRVLVSLQWANNETGVLQPVAEVAAVAHRFGALFHTDAVQAAGKVAVDFRMSGADFMTLSGHKLGGPKGVGALVVRDGLDAPRLLRGGGQERGGRAGTENVPGIVAYGAATTAAQRDLAAHGGSMRGHRDRIEGFVGEGASGAIVIAAASERLPNTSCIAVPGKSAETLVIAFDLAGIAVSAGSACSSGKVKQSHVLTAMGLPPEIAGSAIRVSTGWNTTDVDIDAFLTAFAKIVGNINSLARKVA